jgi:hypothetical protein
MLDKTRAHHGIYPHAVALAAVVLVLGGALYVLFDLRAAARPQAPAPDDGMAAASASSSASARLSVVEWRSSVVRTDGAGMPTSQVSVTIDGTTYELGTVSGTCGDRTGDLLPAEMSAYVCRSRGGGAEYGLFQEDGGLVVKKGDLGEGTADGTELRGNFTAIAAVAR